MKTERSAILKGAGLLAFLVTSILLFAHTRLGDFIKPQKLQSIIEQAGATGPFVFIFVYAAGICAFLPSTLFTGIGGVLFGPFWGFLYNVSGAMLGASAAFAIGRTFGRPFATSVIGGKLQAYDETIARNGFATTLYLRLVFFPFTPLNFGMGLTRIRFIEYFLGTFFGILAGGFAMTFFFARFASVWRGRNGETLYNIQSVLALSLFIGSFFLPKVAKRMNLIKDPGPSVRRKEATMGKDIQPDAIREAIRNKYAEVSRSAEGKFDYPTGRSGAEALQYDPAILESTPAGLLGCFCGVGNPFSLGKIEPGNTVLDLGCGCGFDLSIAARLVGESGKVTGIDLTAEMARQAEKNLLDAGISNATVLQVESEKIPLPDDFFDVVISNGVLNLSPCKETSYNEIFRVLKPAGRLQFADIVLKQELPESQVNSLEAWSQ